VFKAGPFWKRGFLSKPLKKAILAHFGKVFLTFFFWQKFGIYLVPPPPPKKQKKIHKKGLNTSG